MKKTNTPNTRRTGSTRVTTTNATYTSTGKNIYFDGTSYRVRVSKDGLKYSKNFDTKTKAVRYRNQILNGTLVVTA